MKQIEITSFKDCSQKGEKNIQCIGNNNNVTIHKHYHIDTALVLQLEALTEKYRELLEFTALLLDQKQREFKQQNKEITT
jgi:hypothetical protein